MPRASNGYPGFGVPPPLYNNSWEFEQQNLRLYMNYLLARLRVGIDSCCGERHIPEAINAIKAELEVIVQQHGFASILGISLPPSYFIQELVMSTFWRTRSTWESGRADIEKSNTMATVIRALFTDTDPDVDHHLVKTADPTAKFSWWDGGAIPTRQDLDELYEVLLLDVIDPDEPLYEGKFNFKESSATAMLDPGLPIRWLHQLLTKPYDVLEGELSSIKYDYHDLPKEVHFRRTTQDLIGDGTVHLLDTLKAFRDTTVYPKESGANEAQQTMSDSTLHPLIVEANDIAQELHACLARQEEAMTRSINTLTTHQLLKLFADKKKDVPFPIPLRIIDPDASDSKRSRSPPPVRPPVVQPAPLPPRPTQQSSFRKDIVMLDSMPSSAKPIPNSSSRPSMHAPSDLEEQSDSAGELPASSDETSSSSSKSESTSESEEEVQLVLPGTNIQPLLQQGFKSLRIGTTAVHSPDERPVIEFSTLEGRGRFA